MSHLFANSEHLFLFTKVVLVVFASILSSIFVEFSIGLDEKEDKIKKKKDNKSINRIFMKSVLKSIGVFVLAYFISVLILTFAIFIFLPQLMNADNYWSFLKNVSEIIWMPLLFSVVSSIVVVILMKKIKKKKFLAYCSLLIHIAITFFYIYASAPLNYEFSIPVQLITDEFKRQPIDILVEDDKEFFDTLEDDKYITKVIDNKVSEPSPIPTAPSKQNANTIEPKTFIEYINAVQNNIIVNKDLAIQYLYKAYDLYNTGTINVDKNKAYVGLMWYYLGLFESELNSKENYYRSALLIFEELEYWYNVAVTYSKLLEYDNSIKYYLKIAESESNDKNDRAEAFKEVADMYYYNKNDYQSAFSYYLLSLNLAESNLIIADINSIFVDILLSSYYDNNFENVKLITDIYKQSNYLSLKSAILYYNSLIKTNEYSDIDMEYINSITKHYDLNPKLHIYSAYILYCNNKVYSDEMNIAYNIYKNSLDVFEYYSEKDLINLSKLLFASHRYIEAYNVAANIVSNDLEINSEKILLQASSYYLIKDNFPSSIKEMEFLLDKLTQAAEFFSQNNSNKQGTCLLLKSLIQLDLGANASETEMEEALKLVDFSNHNNLYLAAQIAIRKKNYVEAIDLCTRHLQNDTFTDISEFEVRLLKGNAHYYHSQTLKDKKLKNEQLDFCIKEYEIVLNGVENVYGRANYFLYNAYLDKGDTEKALKYKEAYEVWEKNRQ